MATTKTQKLMQQARQTQADDQERKRRERDRVSKAMSLALRRTTGRVPARASARPTKAELEVAKDYAAVARQRARATPMLLPGLGFQQMELDDKDQLAFSAPI